MRLLTLTGAGGTGKTRLAVEATAGLDDEFPGGVVLVELAPIGDPDLVATTIADALGLVERPGTRIARGAGRLPARPAGAARARQLRAGARRGADARRAAHGCTRPDAPRHQPRAARHLRGADLPRPRAPASRPVSPPRGRPSPAHRGGTAVRRSRARRDGPTSSSPS